MTNPKTTTLGILTILSALALGAKEILSTGSLLSLPTLLGQLAAGFGLIHASDAPSQS